VPKYLGQSSNKEKFMKKELGKRGEDIASSYMQEHGYRILQRNFRCGYGEVDIICTQAQVLVFVEVKTRTGQGFGSPEESITRTKKEHIRKVALIFLETCALSFREIRFDVVGILMHDGQPQINHIEAAF
jgi:putative endonuclease